MRMKWNIEKSQKSDCKPITEFITKAWNETYKGIINDEFLEGMKNTEERRYTNAINNYNDKTNMQYIIKDNNRIIGFLKLSKTDNNEEENDCLELQSLYVLKEFQKNNLGKKLINKAFEEAKKMGYKELIVGCLEGNDSNGFYKKMGGEFIKKREFKLQNQTLYENVYRYKLY